MDHARQLRALDLANRLWVGDAILTGGSDPVSTLIQTGSRSPYSHIGVVIGPGLLIEAYDYALTPDESDEGVFVIALDDFLDRCSHLRAVEVRRPLRIDRSRLLATARHLEGHSPGFPTLGMACLALCGLSDPVLDILPGSVRGRITSTLAEVAADGVWALHCAETATRLYHAAGVPLRFRSPRLWPQLRALQGSRAALVDLPAGPRQAEEGVWPRGFGLAPYAVSSTMQAVARRARRAWRYQPAPTTTVAEARTVVEARTGARHPSTATGDVADLILPGDFARADPFRLVGRYRRRTDRWVEVAQTPAPAGPPTPDRAGATRPRRAEPPSPGRAVTGSRPASLSR